MKVTAMHLKYAVHAQVRDTDKVKATGLSPAFYGDAVYFDEAKMVFICRKLYAQNLDPSSFLDKEALSTYSAGDFHRVYVSEIVKALVKE